MLQSAWAPLRLFTGRGDGTEAAVRPDPSQIQPDPTNPTRPMKPLQFPPDSLEYQIRVCRISAAALLVVMVGLRRLCTPIPSCRDLLRELCRPIPSYGRLVRWLRLFRSACDGAIHTRCEAERSRHSRNGKQLVLTNMLRGGGENARAQRYAPAPTMVHPL